MYVTFPKLGQYGRLGNQLWQIAATIGYARRYNTNYYFPHWEYEDKFNVPKDRFVDRSELGASRAQRAVYEELHFHYSGIPLYNNGVNLHGYFQSYKYWQDYGGEIKQLLTPKEKQEERADTTSIHVRRTDYLIHTDCYNILDMKYYESAIAEINAHKCLVFSDDMEWCKQNFIGNNFEFSEGNTPVRDLSIMLSCTNNIIANSSFSWWAAYLNPNNNKKILAPKVWFGPKLSPTHDTKDLYPEEWMKI